MKSKQAKRDEAQTRQEKRKALTATQQISKLDKKLGKGKGAKKERKRLAAS